MDRPAFASSVLSGANRIVAPSVPPDLSLTSNVPAACHPSRIIIGQAFAFWLIVAFRISDSSADILTRDIASCRRGRRRGKEKSEDGWWYMGYRIHFACVVCAAGRQGAACRRCLTSRALMTPVWLIMRQQQ